NSRLLGQKARFVFPKEILPADTAALLGTLALKLDCCRQEGVPQLNARESRATKNRHQFLLVDSNSAYTFRQISKHWGCTAAREQDGCSTPGLHARLSISH